MLERELFVNNLSVSSTVMRFQSRQLNLAWKSIDYDNTILIRVIRIEKVQGSRYIPRVSKVKFR